MYKQNPVIFKNREHNCEIYTIKRFRQVHKNRYGFTIAIQVLSYEIYQLGQSAICGLTLSKKYAIHFE